MSKYLAKENKMIKEVYHFALTRNYISSLEIRAIKWVMLILIFQRHKYVFQLIV